MDQAEWIRKNGPPDFSKTMDLLRPYFLGNVTPDESKLILSYTSAALKERLAPFQRTGSQNIIVKMTAYFGSGTMVRPLSDLPPI
jgi:hypothetical protein